MGVKIMPVFVKKGSKKMTFGVSVSSLANIGVKHDKVHKEFKSALKGVDVSNFKSVSDALEKHGGFKKAIDDYYKSLEGKK